MSNIPKLVIGSESELLKYLQNASGNNFACNKIYEYVDSLRTKINIELITLVKDKKFIPVSELEKALEFAYVKPHLSKRSKLIIYPINRLNTEGQNKILKLVEEPPQYLDIFLLAESDKEIILTIRSRVEMIKLDSTSLEENDTTKEAKKLIQELFTQAQGSPKSQFRAYKDIDQKLSKIKDSQSKREFISAMISELRKKTGSLIAEGDFVRANKIIELNTKLEQAVRFNVNPKIVVDRIFLEYLRLV